MNYEENAKIFKAVSDQSRLKIIDILSCGERCACDILEYFDFTQPTLSHHMRVLSNCGLIEVRKEGLWNYYRLNINNCNKLTLFMMNLVTETKDCICNDKSKCTCK
ncbi:ArsR family transcriptional regulator [Clostridium chromiireducens]|nr:ArsR family transcriptional regulator [Clostridium chromiireducens]